MYAKRKHISDKPYRLTEAEIRRIVKESIRTVILESEIEGPLKISDYFDISAITDEDILSICNDMRIFIAGRGLGENIYYNGKEFIVESGVPTLSPSRTKKRLVELGYKDWQAVVKTVANKVKVIIFYPDIADNTDTIISTMKSMGWDFARISEPDLVGPVKCRIIEFNPSTQKDLTADANRYKFLYHITPAKNLNSIMENGIEARSSNEYLNYPPRAHLLKGNLRKIVIAHFGWTLYHASNNDDGKYVVLRLDMDKVPGSISFYGDPRFEYGYITKNQTIPPECLEVYGYVNYFDKDNYYDETIRVVVKDDVLND